MINMGQEIYTKLAKKYLEGNTTIHGLCLEYEQKHGWYPNERTLYKYVTSSPHLK